MNDCPRCKAQITEPTNFCNKCGMRLRADTNGPLSTSKDGIDWSKTWVADMFMSEDERLRREAAAILSDDPEAIVLAEMKRTKGIKAGVVTASVGLGVSIFLAVFLTALASTIEARNPGAATILRNIWFVGIIPIFIGMALIVNALFVDTGILQRKVQSGGKGVRDREGRVTNELPALSPPPSVVSSVTEGTTDLLEEPRGGLKDREGLTH